MEATELGWPWRIHGKLVWHAVVQAVTVADIVVVVAVTAVIVAVVGTVLVVVTVLVLVTAVVVHVIAAVVSGKTRSPENSIILKTENQ